MRSAVLRERKLVIEEVDDPVPDEGQVLVRVLACGICGSDLHFAKHGAALVDQARDLAESIGPFAAMDVDLSRDVFMGHEFACEVLEAGPGTAAQAPGTAVVSIPVLFAAGRLVQLAYNNDHPGGFAERMLLSAPLLQEVPAGVGAAAASMTEPLAVGIHAVGRARMDNGYAAVVLGCGPVGLAVIAALRRNATAPIVAADPSPLRRNLAAALGADHVVDPAAEGAVAAWRRLDGRRSLVIFEAVGAPGMLEAAMRDCPLGGRIVVVGACMEPDTVRPLAGVVKELDIRFSFAYSPQDFATALRVIADGSFDAGALVTSTVGLDELPDAFRQLEDPAAEAKIVVVPT